MPSDFRNRQSGKFSYSKMDRPCTCGHTLGVHLAEGDRECINHEAGDGSACKCVKFTPATKPR